MKYILWLLSIGMLWAQIPAYYSSIDFTETPENIKSQLSTLITNTHLYMYPYTSNNTDTWDIVSIADLDSISTTDVQLIYGFSDTDADVVNDRLRNVNLSCHTSSCYGLWNREHVFPKSLANPQLDTDDPGAGTDVHNLRACDASTNSSRSNRKFTYGSLEYSGLVGSDSFYPGDEWKGDVARIIMYMYLRYGNQCEPNNVSNGSSNSYSSEMPDIFLTWNQEDPVSAIERQRNNVISSFQGNRNPFIDNPYLATLIWGGPQAQNSWNLSVEDLQFDTSLVQLYPSPVHDVLYVSEPIVSGEIYNLNGMKLGNYLQNTSNVSQLQKGVYILKVKLISGKVISKQFIKN